MNSRTETRTPLEREPREGRDGEREAEVYRRVPLFRHLDHREIAAFLADSEPVEARAGQVIIRQGDPADAFYVIGAGSFDVLRNGTTIARLGELSFFGEMSLMDTHPRSATVVCREPGRLHRFSIETFDRRLARQDTVALQIVRGMATILAERLERVLESLART